MIIEQWLNDYLAQVFVYMFGAFVVVMTVRRISIWLDDDRA